ncbi:unnamed protein product, partial [Brachionus calyciflorus]
MAYIEPFEDQEEQKREKSTGYKQLLFYEYN